MLNSDLKNSIKVFLETCDVLDNVGLGINLIPELANSGNTLRECCLMELRAYLVLFLEEKNNLGKSEIECLNFYLDTSLPSVCCEETINDYVLSMKNLIDTIGENQIVMFLICESEKQCFLNNMKLDESIITLYLHIIELLRNETLEYCNALDSAKILKANYYINSIKENIKNIHFSPSIIEGLNYEMHPIPCEVADENKSCFNEQSQECSKKNTLDITSLTGIEFEKICKQLMQNMGFEVYQTKASGDGGIDLIALNHQPFTEGKYIVQCKRYNGSVGEPIIRDLYGVICSERANKGILITTGYFTNNAILFAKDKNIELIDGDTLYALLTSNNIENQQYQSNNKTNKTIVQVCEDNDLTTLLQLIESANECPKNDKLIAELIVKLTDYALDDLLLWVEEQSDRLIIMSEIHKWCEHYRKTVKSTNIQIKFLIAAQTIIEIQCYLLEGNFYQAYMLYKELHHRPELNTEAIIWKNPVLAENLWLITAVYNITYNVIQTSLLFDYPLITQRLFEIGKDYVQIFKEHLEIYYKEKEDDSHVARAINLELKNIKEINILNGYYLIEEDFIKSATDIVYSINSAFPYSGNWYPLKIEDDSLIFMCGSLKFKDNNIDVYLTNEQEYIRIDNLSKKLKESKNLLL